MARRRCPPTTMSTTHRGLGLSKITFSLQSPSNRHIVPSGDPLSSCQPRSMPCPPHKGLCQRHCQMNTRMRKRFIHGRSTKSRVFSQTSIPIPQTAGQVTGRSRCARGCKHKQRGGEGREWWRKNFLLERYGFQITFSFRGSRCGYIPFEWMWLKRGVSWEQTSFVAHTCRVSQSVSYLIFLLLVSLLFSVGIVSSNMDSRYTSCTR